jgi:hypothetical protein
MDMKVWVHGRGKRINGPVAEEGILRTRKNQEMSYV